MWKPREAQETMLDRAMWHINHIPYSATARWVFYRLLQEGFYGGKDDYGSRFLPITSRARKEFYKGWHPNTLEDDTRGIIPGGEGFKTSEEWLEAVQKLTYIKPKHGAFYLEVWFEARAMIRQFQWYVKDIPLMGFGGDTSIDAKGKTASRLKQASEFYGLPVIILYFGDYDKKGNEIPNSALKDIRAWCSIEFEYIRAGLNKGDGERLGIPENPEKPGQYQWEALDDALASEIILTAIEPYQIEKQALAVITKEQEEVTDKFKQRFETFISNWD